MESDWETHLSSDEEYRKNVGIVLINDANQVLWAKRLRQQSAWQFPQGGMDEGETIYDALYRELKEELGLDPEEVQVITETKDWVSYAIPEKYQRRSAPFVCRGQRQKWFLLKLIAAESQIQLDYSEFPEFSDWRWVDFWYPVDHVIDFKRDVYQKVLEEFSSFVGK